MLSKKRKQDFFIQLKYIFKIKNISSIIRRCMITLSYQYWNSKQRIFFQTGKYTEYFSWHVSIKDSYKCRNTINIIFGPSLVKLLSKQKFKIYKSFESHEVWQSTKELWLLSYSFLAVGYTHKFLIATDILMPFVSSDVIDIYLHISLTHVVSHFEGKCKEHIISQFSRCRSLDN